MEMRYRSKLRGALTKVLIISIFLVALLTLPHASPVQAQTDDYSDKKSEATLLRTDGTPRVGTINSDTPTTTTSTISSSKLSAVHPLHLRIGVRRQGSGYPARRRNSRSSILTRAGPRPSEGQVESRTEGMKTITVGCPDRRHLLLHSLNGLCVRNGKPLPRAIQTHGPRQKPTWKTSTSTRGTNRKE